MKFNFTLAIILLFSFQSFSQENYQWDVITDSLSKTKSELYSLSKLFIAEVYNSPKTVIHLDDKEAGVLLLKCSSDQEVYHMLSNFHYVYHYTVKIMVKDNKTRITISDVYCDDAYYKTSTKTGKVVKIQPFTSEENCPATKDSWGTGINTKKAIIMMENFKATLQSIVDGYVLKSKESVVVDDNW